MEEIKNVNLTQLKTFKNHPFSVNFDKDFFTIQNITYIQSSNLLKSTLVNFAKKVLYGQDILCV